jgi:hypothetical protein
VIATGASIECRTTRSQQPMMIEIATNNETASHLRRDTLDIGRCPLSSIEVCAPLFDAEDDTETAILRTFRCKL